MLANWKSLAIAIGMLPALWGSAGTAGEISAEIPMNAPALRGSAAQRAMRCTIPIQWAYPAAELVVLAEDAHF